MLSFRLCGFGSRDLDMSAVSSVDAISLLVLACFHVCFDPSCTEHKVHSRIFPCLQDPSTANIRVM